MIAGTSEDLAVRAGKGWVAHNDTTEASKRIVARSITCPVCHGNINASPGFRENLRSPQKNRHVLYLIASPNGEPFAFPMPVVVQVPSGSKLA
jgi:hypothetical protein